MDEEFIRNRITELRLKKGAIRISNEFGFRTEPELYSGDFIRSISSVNGSVLKNL